MVYIGTGMCGPKGHVFLAIVVINTGTVSILAIWVVNKVLCVVVSLHSCGYVF